MLSQKCCTICFVSIGPNKSNADAANCSHSRRVLYFPILPLRIAGTLIRRNLFLHGRVDDVAYAVALRDIVRGSAQPPDDALHTHPLYGSPVIRPGLRSEVSGSLAV